jgi:hypothetical protein
LDSNFRWSSIQFCAGINNTVSQNGNTLTATQSGANYQWINCANNTPISGADSQTFTATANGSYAVIITSGACSDTSECTTFSTIGLNENELTTFSIFPNPANETVYFRNVNTGSQIRVLDLSGKLIYASKFNASNNTISVSNWSNGMYIVEIEHEGIINQTKLVVND